ncbi:Spy/CpxP family protein refolding chaperone [Falsiroseomonas sp. CW058]|uniref:Spy/CpxP family protein refolding chaperone n=1 Tax=Falsiroseomonas sp. CW058 TaxID=3388664 RepID=UPI003D31C12E
MRKVTSIPVAALLALGIASGATAQAPAADDADHGAHHPDTAQVAPQPAPQAPPAPGRGAPGMAGPGGMMGGPGEMMGQMMQQRMATAAMQPFRRIEGQLAYFRAELRITDALAPQWNTFADVVRAQAERLRAATRSAMSGGPGPLPAPQQMERRMALLAAHLEAMRAVSAAAGPLYAALSEEQRRTADELMAEHLRGMRMGMM